MPTPSWPHLAWPGKQIQLEVNSTSSWLLTVKRRSWKSGKWAKCMQAKVERKTQLTPPLFRCRVHLSPLPIFFSCPVSLGKVSKSILHGRRLPFRQGETDSCLLINGMRFPSCHVGGAVRWDWYRRGRGALRKMQTKWNLCEADEVREIENGSQRCSNCRKKNLA